MPLSTVGVDLGIWKYRKDLEPEYLRQKKKGAKQLRSVTFYTWDFGGQVWECILALYFELSSLFISPPGGHGICTVVKNIECDMLHTETV